MSKYATDSYLLHLFDRVGARTKTVPVESFTHGQGEGELAQKQGRCFSFAVARVLFNSATPKLERYDIRNQLR
jgi:hypothetical protein